MKGPWEKDWVVENEQSEEVLMFLAEKSRVNSYRRMKGRGTLELNVPK